MYKKIILLSLIIIPLYIFPATGKVKGIKDLKKDGGRLELIKQNLQSSLPRPSVKCNPFPSPTVTPWEQDREMLDRGSIYYDQSDLRNIL